MTATNSDPEKMPSLMDSHVACHRFADISFKEHNAYMGWTKIFR